MNKMDIGIHYYSGIILPDFKKSNVDQNIVLTFTSNLMKLGYIPSKELLNAMSEMSESYFINFSEKLIKSVQRVVGDDVEYTPFYPNFPQEVMDKSLVELYLNAIIHYWTFGQWKPEIEKLPRQFKMEKIKFKILKLISSETFDSIFSHILSSNDSISSYDKKVIEWYLDKYDIQDLTFPTEIPFKENLTLVIGIMLKKNIDISYAFSNATDVLRVATYLSDGDISLSENTKFKSFSRKIRKMLVSGLERVIKEEDIKRHYNKWKALFHSLHVGEYKFATNVNSIASKVRDNATLTSFYSKIEEYINNGDESALIRSIKSRPSEFARRIDHILRLDCFSSINVAEAFITVLDKIPTRVLLQLLGNIRVRNNEDRVRVVIPKGMLKKSVILDSELPKIDEKIISLLSSKIEDSIRERFSSLKPLGKVWIDDKLKGCPVPSQMRNASDGKNVVARGTRIPIDLSEKNTIRLFLYWIGRDIDLSTVFFDEDMNRVNHIAYTNLKNSYSCHSGDITYALDGASEFVDIDVNKALENGVKYATLDVRVYSGPSFKEHEKCYVGFMTRKYPNSNEIYDPSLVEYKIDMIGESNTAVPVIFDLENQELIWVDMYGVNSEYNNNTIENSASVKDILKSIIYKDNKVSLYELFKYHVDSRGELIDDKESADVIFTIDESKDEKEISVFDIMKINSEYLV